MFPTPTNKDKITQKRELLNLKGIKKENNIAKTVKSFKNKQSPRITKAEKYTKLMEEATKQLAKDKV